MLKLILLILIGWAARSFTRRHRWWFQVRKFKTNPVCTEPVILFTGSSSIRFWSSLQRDMYPLLVINRGFGGSSIADLVRYADYIFFGLKVKAVLVYSGENDVAWSRRNSPESILKNVQSFVDLVQTKHASPIFFISQKLPPFHRKRWDRLKQVNEIIRNFAATHPGVTFIEITTEMFDSNGQPRSELYRRDGIHLSEQGYALWTSLVKPHLANLIN